MKCTAFREGLQFCFLVLAPIQFFGLVEFECRADCFFIAAICSRNSL